MPDTVTSDIQLKGLRLNPKLLRNGCNLKQLSEGKITDLSRSAIEMPNNIAHVLGVQRFLITQPSPRKNSMQTETGRGVNQL